ncbi:LysR family transcriptional regulator [Tolumonas lignilytica]|jgi:Transcriptional regulator|uniref:LysR family transcriptional regulator n=1 Tax=Tolumonas lignilytica TaxID=1283284 RepID=UPI000467AA03|nr:LysR family transcriptional regulator [Tolumonas lignilytica]
MDHLRNLSALIAVVECGSFVAAAQRMHSSKAAVSRYIQELETYLGVRLLQRSTRRIALTEAGRDYYQRTKQILVDLDDANSAVGANNASLVGNIRVNAPLTFGTRYLAPLWAEFMERHPSITLDIELNDRRVDLLEEGFDLAIRIGNLADSSLVSRRLSNSHAVLCASPAYLEKYGTPTTPEELAQHQAISYSYLPTGDIWHFYSAKQGERAINIKARMHTNNGDTIRAVVLAGQGIALQPIFQVGPDIQEGKLVTFMTEWAGPSFGIHAVYPSRKHLSLKVKTLIDYLAEKLAGTDWQQPANT